MKRLTAAIACAVAVVACGQDAPPPPAELLNPPDSVAAAPDSFDVVFETGKGSFTVRAVRAWAPRGVDRFHWLVRNGFYDRNKFFRVVPDFVVQFGISGDPQVNTALFDRTIRDDSVKQSNRAGYVTFATGGPNTRTTQLFINKRDNARLDGMGFAPIGRVIDGMSVVQALHGGYGEGPPYGMGPDQDLIQREGNAYLNRRYPQLDSIVRATVK